MNPRARADLLRWYDGCRRDLPWRRTFEPWPIWVSEVMLQQTRVSVVEPYFVRFLERFPTPSSLAVAPEDELLALWSGLGYYRRARQLQAGARAVAEAGGAVPRTAAELERLPGVGPYTAAAIASIAFGEAVAVLDGNVARVMARLGALALDPGRPAERRLLQAAAQRWIDPDRAGDSNQALMELGATICLPRSPRCGSCPLAQRCAARRRGETEAYPPRRRRPAPRRLRRVAALVVNARGEMLLTRRGRQEKQLAGLWELPSVDAGDAEEAARALSIRYGGAWTLIDEAARARHGITSSEIEVAAWRASWTGAEVAEGPEARWVSAAGAGELALTAATRKLLARLSASG